MSALIAERWATGRMNVRKEGKQHLEELAIAAENKDIGRLNANYQEHLHLHQSINQEDQDLEVLQIEEIVLKVHLMTNDHIRKTNLESNLKRREVLHHKMKRSPHL